MAKSSGKAVIIIDCDLQDPPEVIPQMIEKWKTGVDIVYGSAQKEKAKARLKNLPPGSTTRSCEPLEVSTFRRTPEISD